MDPVEEIKSRLSIEDVVGRQVELKRSGASYKGLCPFHQEKTPSFYVSPSRGTYHCFGCLEEREPIWTAAGLRPIREVRIDDCVLDSFGAMQRVVAKEVKSGDLVAIETDSFREDPLLLTPDHTCLVVRRDEAVHKVRRIARDAGRGLKFYGRYHSYRGERSVNLAEVEATTVEVGDFFVFPVIDEDTRRAQPLFDPAAIRPYTSGPRTDRVSFLPVNERAAWLYGLWLAEGSTGRGFVRFSLSITERETLARQAVDILRGEFGLEATIFDYPMHHVCEVICSKTDLEGQFKHWFGAGAGGKRIPCEALTWPISVQRALIRGYLDGDGEKNFPTSATVSQSLAYGLFALAVQCALLPSLRKQESWQAPNGVRHRAAWTLILRSREGLRGFYESINGVKYYWSQVRSITPVSDEHRVVDITVASSSTFVTKMGATHNCGKGGDIFSFVMDTQHLAFPEALKVLAGQAGVSLPERDAAKPSLKGRLYEANEAAATFFGECLRAAQGTRARQYLAERGFEAEAIDLFDLGCAPEGREALTQHLHQAGFDDRILLAAGLTLQDEIGGKTRDRFRGRLMFPIRDRSGRITGFGGRTLGDAQPKYLNSPQTEIFDKSATLFGIHRGQEAIRQAGKVALVEGYLDAIRAHISGYSWVVASLGTAITVQQLSALSRLTDTVILALDPDTAGQSAAARTSVTALAEVTSARGQAAGGSKALDLRIARLPAGKGDPDELLRDHPEEWDRAIKESIPAFEFYFTQTLQALDRSSETWRQDAIDQMLPIIQQFGGSAGWQAVWLERLARETGIDPRALQRSITAPPRPRRGRPARTEGNQGQEIVSGTTARALATDPGASVERALVSLLLKLVIVPDEAARSLAGERLQDEDHRLLVARLLGWQAKGNYDYEMFRETLPEALRKRADELHSLDVPLPDDAKISVAVKSLLARMRHFQLEAQFNRASQLLQEVGSEDRDSALANVAELMRVRRSVEEELDQLSRRAVQSSAVDQGTIDQDSGRL